MVSTRNRWRRPSSAARSIGKRIPKESFLYKPALRIYDAWRWVWRRLF